jgi:hypothetical protein
LPGTPDVDFGGSDRDCERGAGPLSFVDAYDCEDLFSDAEGNETNMGGASEGALRFGDTVFVIPLTVGNVLSENCRSSSSIEGNRCSTDMSCLAVEEFVLERGWYFGVTEEDIGFGWEEFAVLNTGDEVEALPASEVWT